MEDPKKRDAEPMIIDRWPQPTEFGSWKTSFMSEVIHSSASTTGKPTPDFENLDFKIASGLRKMLTGNFKKQVTSAEGKTPSEKRSLTFGQIAWMICDFFKTCGDNEANLDFGFIERITIER